MDTWQWVVMAGLIGFGLWRRGVFKFGGSSTTTATTPDANAVAAAYRLLTPYLDEETAKKVRASVAEMFLTIVPTAPTAPTTKAAEGLTIEKVIAIIDQLAAAKSKEVAS